MEKLAQTLAVDQPSNLIFPQVKGGFREKVGGGGRMPPRPFSNILRQNHQQNTQMNVVVQFSLLSPAVEIF